MNIQEHSSLTGAGRGHQDDETVVQFGCLANTSYDSIGEWLSQLPISFHFSVVASSSSSY
jgi:hypothetical protein